MKGMGMKLGGRVLGFAMLLGPSAAAAQLPRVDVIPFAGAYRPIQALPLVREDGQDVAASLADGFAAGAAAEVRVLGPLRIRGTWLRAHTELAVGSTAESTRRGDARVDILAADLVVSAPRLGIARPYLLVGTGTKRYVFDREAMGAGASEAFGDGRSDRTGHLGLGVELNARRFGIRVEASDYTSVFRSAQAGSSSAGSRQHDLLYSASIRLRAF